MAVVHGGADLYGASRVLLSEVAVLQAIGHDVKVIAPEEGPLARAVRAIGADFAVDSRLPVLRRTRPQDLVKDYSVRRFKDIDVVVLWTLALVPFIPVLLAARLPFYVSVHEYFPSAWGRALVSPLRCGNFPIQCCSEAVGGWLQSEGVDESRLSICRPIFEPAEVKRPSVHHDPFRISVIGRINGLKGHLQVAELLDHELLQNLNIEINLVGSSYKDRTREEDRLRRVAAKNPGRVNLLGERPVREDIEKYTDLVLSIPARPESFGLVPLEAWSRGVRSMGYSEGGATEVLGHVGGSAIVRGQSVASAVRYTLDNWDELVPLPSPDQVLPSYSQRCREQAVEEILCALAP